MFYGNHDTSESKKSLVALQPRYWLPHSDYSYTRKEILESNAFVENYNFYSNVYDCDLAVLKHSEPSAQIHEVLEKEFSLIYPGCVMSNYRAAPMDALNRE